MDDAPQPPGDGADVALLEVPAHQLDQQSAPLHQIAHELASRDSTHDKSVN